MTGMSHKGVNTWENKVLATTFGSGSGRDYVNFLTTPQESEASFDADASTLKTPFPCSVYGLLGSGSSIFCGPIYGCVFWMWSQGYFELFFSSVSTR